MIQTEDAYISTVSGSDFDKTVSALQRMWHTLIKIDVEGFELAYIAKVSYALYIIHPLTTYGWLGSGEAIVKYAKRPLSLLLTFGLAHISTFYYEKRWIAWGKRWASQYPPL